MTEQTENKSGRKSWIIVAVMFIVFGGLLLGLFLIPGLGLDGKTGQAQETFRQYVEAQSGGHIHLDSFTKTDGQEAEAFGVPIYGLKFRATISFPGAGVWLAHNSMAGPGLTFTFAERAGAFGMMSGATQVQAGSTVAIEGTMNGGKSDNGWKFDMGDCQIAAGQ